MNKDDLLRIGVITQPHGVRGEVKVFPTTDEPKRYKKTDEVILVNKKEMKTLHIEGVKFFKNMVIVKFKEFNNRDEIESLRQAELMVTRENAIKLKPGEYFLCDVIGCKVYDDENDELIGEVIDTIETGANNVFAIKTVDDKEVLFPVIDECIKNVDVEAKQIKAHVMKGLMDL